MTTISYGSLELITELVNNNYILKLGNNTPNGFNTLLNIPHLTSPIQGGNYYTLDIENTNNTTTIGLIVPTNCVLYLENNISEGFFGIYKNGDRAATKLIPGPNENNQYVELLSKENIFITLFYFSTEQDMYTNKNYWYFTIYFNYNKTTNPKPYIITYNGNEDSLEINTIGDNTSLNVTQTSAISKALQLTSGSYRFCIPTGTNTLGAISTDSFIFFVYSNAFVLWPPSSNNICQAPFYGINYTNTTSTGHNLISIASGANIAFLTNESNNNIITGNQCCNLDNPGGCANSNNIPLCNGSIEYVVTPHIITWYGNTQSSTQTIKPQLCLRCNKIKRNNY